MEKVFTWLVSPLITATMALESMPPLRYAPNGTSLTMCSRTARLKVASKASRHSSSDG